MSSLWKYHFTESPASEEGGPVLPETLATKTGVEPCSESSSENSSSEGPMSLQFNSTMASDSSSYYSEASTGTDGPAPPASTSVTEQTTSNTSTTPSPTQDNPHARLGEDIDCVFFDSNSYVGSPTINIDSNDATGATNNTPDDTFRPQQPPSAMAYSPQTTHARRRERVTHVGPGTVMGSITINIRSDRASGAIDTIIPSRARA
ncbi:hypothetical protein EV702DRAFT_1151612, partial [Suillus placidus]